MIYIPNLITSLRIALVPCLIVVLQDQQFLLALLIFLVAGISDALDGFVAKHFNVETRLGAILDPIADKALLVSTYVMLTLAQAVPFWLTVTVVFRDVLIVVGYLVMILFFNQITTQQIRTTPLLVSKVNTFLQIVFVVLVLVNLTWSLDLTLSITLFAYAVFATSVSSGAAYVAIAARGIARANDVGNSA